jgi:hypothetical protein
LLDNFYNRQKIGRTFRNDGQGDFIPNAWATNMLIDLTEHEKCAEKVLEKSMVPFVHFGCPLLHRTLPKKTLVEGIIILHDWWKTKDSDDGCSTPRKWSSSALNGAVGHIDEVIGGLYDPSLTPLFKSSSPWSVKLLSAKGWLATNAVWGQRPSKNVSGPLGKERDQAGLLVWGGITEKIVLRNPSLKIVLAGAWPLKGGMTPDKSYSAKQFCSFWGGSLQRQQAKTAFTSDALALLKSMSSSAARFFTVYHPLVWPQKYKNLPSKCPTVP